MPVSVVKQVAVVKVVAVVREVAVVEVVVVNRDAEADAVLQASRFHIRGWDSY